MAEGDPEANARLLDTPRTSLLSFPTCVRKGLLFVWADEESAHEAAACEPFVAEELSDDPNWGVNDAPSGWRVWMEQSWDPSHAPFLHQYSLPNFAPENAMAMTPFRVEDLGDTGFTAEHGGYMTSNQDLEAKRRFAAPCCNSTTYKYPDGRIIGFCFYFVPMEPGRVRQITTSYFVPAPEGAEDKSKGGLQGNQLQMSKVVLQGRTLKAVSDKKPRKGPKELFFHLLESRWPDLGRVRKGLDCLRLASGKLGDQDNAILSFQGAVGLPAVRSGNLRAMRPSQRFGGPDSEYVLETHADELIVRFDAWLTSRGGGPFGPSGEDGDRPFTDAELMDRWTLTTKSNPDMQVAMDFVGKTVALLENRGTPYALGAVAVCLSFGAVRVASIPALFAAASLTYTARLRRLAHSFMSGLPPQPELPVRQLWER